MEIPLLQDIVLIFALSVLVIWLFHKIKIPSIIGFLFTGMLVGPLGVISELTNISLIENAHHEIDYLAEIGVVLLLFTIGIEFSIKNLFKIKRTVLLGGSIQVTLTVVLTYIVAVNYGYGFGESVFMGFLVALSSTAIVLRILQEKAQISSLHGKTSLGILIFQDIIIVPMILFTPILAGKSANVTNEILILLAKAVGLIALTIVSSRWIIPKILHQVARTQSQELFLLTVLVVGFTVAWITSMLGLSLALGAFLAGLAISESEYSHQAFGNILPFRDIFTAFFFVSIGMLLDIQFLFANFFTILIFAAIVLLIKTIVTGFVAFILGLPFRTTVMTGLILSQVGEFSFILAKIGMKNGFLITTLANGSVDDYYYQLFLAVTIVTMSVTPFIILAAPKLSDFVVKILPLPQRFINGLRPIPKMKTNGLHNHVIIAGMGLNGSNIARAARQTGIDYVIIDLDADLVREKRAQGEPIIFGDAANESVLKHAGVEKAKVLVSAIGNPASTYSIARGAKVLNPGIYSIVRTRYIEDVEDLFKAGANEVIPEEFETSVEIFSKVLTKYLIPRDEIEKMIAELRSDGYEMFRQVEVGSASLNDFHIVMPDIEISAVRVTEHSQIKGRSLGDIELRKFYGVTLAAIKRESGLITNPDSSTHICSEDILYLLGTEKQINCVLPLFKDANAPSCEIKS